MNPANYGRSRLEFLDGLRGVLAIQVLLVHAKYFFLLPAFIKIFALGGYRVAAFITISGFVLYLPSASDDAVRMKRPFVEYVKRRARRLLLPWYASLLLTCLLFSLMARFHLFGGMPLAESWPGLLWHSTFLHSWNPNHRYSLNSALWFMGYELQLSLCFPLFLTLVRRWSWAVLIGFSVLLTLPVPVWPSEVARFVFSTDLTFPFVIGMFAARMARRPDLFFRSTSALKIKLLLITLTVLSILAHLWCISHGRGVLASCSASVGVAAMAIYLTYFTGTFMYWVLSHRALVFIGSFSYSLFLIHLPLLVLVASLTYKWEMSHSQRFAFIGLPSFVLILAVSYLFYLIFERPLLSSANRRS